MSARPRRFSSGQMRHRITVQSKTETQADSGQLTVTWGAFVSDEPAEYEYTAGGQVIRGRQVEEGIDAVFTVRYRSGYTREMRVVFDGGHYGIVHVRPVGGRQRYLELHTKESDS